PQVIAAQPTAPTAGLPECSGDLRSARVFTAPMDADLGKLESDPSSVRAKAYDLVINGYECGGGSIRIHNPEVQARLFAVLGMAPEQARQRFGFLLDALKFGAPPHGGIALGLDRRTMMLAG